MYIEWNMRNRDAEYKKPNIIVRKRGMIKIDFIFILADFGGEF